MWRPAVSGMEEARIRARSKKQAYPPIFCLPPKASEARDFSHVRFTIIKEPITGHTILFFMQLRQYML